MVPITDHDSQRSRSEDVIISPEKSMVYNGKSLFKWIVAWGNPMNMETSIYRKQSEKREI